MKDQPEQHGHDNEDHHKKVKIEGDKAKGHHQAKEGEHQKEKPKKVDKAKAQDQDKVALGQLTVPAEPVDKSISDADDLLYFDPDMMFDVSKESLHSKASNAPSKAAEPSKDTEHVTASALPVFAPPAEALVDTDSDDEDGDGIDDAHEFDHPSTYANQRWIWLPQDSLHLSKLLLKDLKESGVEASDVGAVMDENGVVEVSRNPPDENWQGGYDN